MANFPSKWFDFTNSKEIKRMRKDLNDTLALKIEISVSIILTIVSFFFGEYFKKLNMGYQILIYSIICVIILLIFFAPNIFKYFSIKKHCNVIIKGKDAVAIFDDEIVYNVLVAAEYSNSKSNIPQNKINSELVSFYEIEIEYYITTAIDQLLQFNTNYHKIVGSKKNQISKKRLQNILNLIDSIVAFNNIKLDSSRYSLYNEFKKI